MEAKEYQIKELGIYILGINLEQIISKCDIHNDPLQLMININAIKHHCINYLLGIKEYPKKAFIVHYNSFKWRHLKYIYFYFL
jgi:hypothetical protein